MPSGSNPEMRAIINLFTKGIMLDKINAWVGEFHNFFDWRDSIKLPLIYVFWEKLYHEGFIKGDVLVKPITKEMLDSHLSWAKSHVDKLQTERERQNKINQKVRATKLKNRRSNLLKIIHRWDPSFQDPGCSFEELHDMFDELRRRKKQELHMKDNIWKRREEVKAALKLLTDKEFEELIIPEYIRRLKTQIQ